MADDPVTTPDPHSGGGQAPKLAGQLANRTASRLGSLGAFRSDFQFASERFYNRGRGRKKDMAMMTGKKPLSGLGKSSDARAEELDRFAASLPLRKIKLTLRPPR